jgi:hypothetical protein
MPKQYKSFLVRLLPATYAKLDDAAWTLHLSKAQLLEKIINEIDLPKEVAKMQDKKDNGE